MKIDRIFMVAGMAVTTFGCGRYTLISQTPTEAVAPQDQWHELKTSREPEGPVEAAVVEATILKSTVESGNIRATFLAADEKSQVVVAAIRNAPTMDTKAPREITMYRVVDGRIGAFTETVSGLSPDSDYEKTIFSSALGARLKRENNVIIYRRPDGNLLVDAKIENRCVIRVIVREGFDMDGEVVAERKINFCVVKD